MVLYGLVGRSKQAIMQSCNHAIMHPDPQVRLSLAKPHLLAQRPSEGDLRASGDVGGVRAIS